jgi:Domain of Unknown Function with PDB structure (DUF3857)
MTSTDRALRPLFLCFLLMLASPRLTRAAVDWLPIPPEDLAMKDNAKQPGSDAMILYREVVDDASKAGTSGDTVEEYVRIKIFTQEGVKFGHIEIPFEKTYQNVVYAAGRTIKPDGTIVKFDGQVLEATIEKQGGLKVLAKTFTLPDVQPGSIVEYKYQTQGQGGWVHSHEWTLSQSVYTREAHFSYVPNTSSDGLHPMYNSYLLPPDAVLREQANGTYVMIAHDIPGIVQEPLMPPERPIQSRVEFYYRDSDAPAETVPSDQYWNHYAKKWDGALEHFVDKKNALNQELSKIISPTDAPEAKLRKIYARAQQIRNLSLEADKTAKETKAENLKENSNVEDVLNHGYGYGTQINYLFVGLARAAGFDATEVYIAPRNRAIFLPARNEVGQLTDELVWVHAGTQDYYLDPAARYFPFGLLPWYETATGGIRIDKRGATMADIPLPPSSDAKIVRNADLEVKSDGSISGTLQIDLTGEQAAWARETERKEDETGRTRYLENEIKAWLPVSAVFKIAKVENWENNDQPVHIEGTVDLPSFANSAARRMLMPLEIFQPSQAGLFASERRINVVYFLYPYQEVDDVKVRLPAGYNVESVPPDRTVNLGAVSYQITAASQGGVVEVKRRLDEQGLFFTQQEYSTLRRFFGVVNTDDHAQMVLQNAPSSKSN